MDFLFNKFENLSDLINRIATWVLIFYVGFNTTLVIIMVLYRATGRGIAWAEELSRWLLIGITFIGASVALKNGLHVGVTILVEKMPPLVKRGLILLANVLVLIFILYFTSYSYQVALGAMGQTGGIIQVPMTLPYLQMPIGGVLMTIHLIYFTLGLFTNRDPGNFALSRLGEGE